MQQIAETRKSYAEMVLGDGVSVREGQRLLIHGNDVHRDLAMSIGEVASDFGVESVRYRFLTTHEIDQMIRTGSSSQIEKYLRETREWYSQAEQADVISLSLHDGFGGGALEAAREASPDNYLAYTRGIRNMTRELSVLRDKGLFIGCSVVSPTARWAERLFPDMAGEASAGRLWENIVNYSRSSYDHPERIRILDALEIRELHIVGGGNDHRVGLSDKALWKSSWVETATGQSFLASFPSFEIASTPDRRLTDGRMVASIPTRLLFNRGLVEDLVISFSNGRARKIEASHGSDHFEALIEDESARYLGQIALLGRDTPIPHMYFDHPILDPNTACHVWLGQGSIQCVQDGVSTSEAALRDIGFNTSSVLQYVVFGSPDVSVVATKCREGEVVLVDQGRWTERFRG